VPSAWIDAMTASSPAAAYYGYQIWRAPGNYRYEDDTGPNGQPRRKTASAPLLDPEMVFFNGFGFQRVWISRAHDLVIVRFGRKWPAA
jgi:CubicO group peptidase (beta-lactamase class C family)